MNGRLFDIIRNTGSTIVIRGLFGISRIVLLLLIAKRFGPDDFGRLSLVLSIVEIVKVLADCGLDIVSIRRFSVNKLLSERILSNTLTLKIVTATIGYILSVTIFQMIYGSLEGLNLILIIGCSIYTSLLSNAFVSYFQANLSMSSIIVSSLSTSLLYLSLTIFGLYNNWTLITLSSIIPLSEFVNLLITAKIYGISNISLRFDRRIILSLLKESIPVALGGLIVVIYSRMDNLMLGWFIGERRVGEYAASYRLTEPFSLLFSSLSLSIYASLSQGSRDADLEGDKQKVIRVMMYVLALSVITSILIYIYANSIMNLISPEYVSSARVLQILSILIVFKAVNSQLTAFINSRGRYSLISVIAFINLIVNIILNLLMIPNYGIIGAALAVTVTEGINSLMQCGCVFYIFRFNLLGVWNRCIPTINRR